MHSPPPSSRQLQRRDLELVAPVQGVMRKRTLQRLTTSNPRKHAVLWHYDHPRVVATRQYGAAHVPLFPNSQGQGPLVVSAKPITVRPVSQHRNHLHPVTNMAPVLYSDATGTVYDLGSCSFDINTIWD